MNPLLPNVPLYYWLLSFDVKSFSKLHNLQKKFLLGEKCMMFVWNNFFQVFQVYWCYIWFLCRLLQEAFEELIGFQYALKEFVGAADTTYAKKYEEFHVGFEGRYVSLYLAVKYW